MSDLPKRLRIKASMIALGERIPWGSDTALMEEAADMIEALSASIENHQLHMLGMARDRDQLRATLDAQPQSAPAGERETIRAVFLRNGFTVKEGQTDLKPYVYAAAEELLSIARAAWQRAQGAVVPEPVRDALARRCLWLAFCWNDHNFGPAHEEARKEALKHGIDSFDAANEWLASTGQEVE